MSRVNFFLFLLSFLVPLVALLLVSLGLVVLKRRSGLSTWMARLVAPPFYLVSLPTATLIVGAEMLGWYFLVVLDDLFSPYGFQLSWVLERFLNIIPYFLLPFSLVSGHYFDVLFGFFAGFWTATVVSGYLLWRTIWREEHHQPLSRIAGRLPRTLLLLLCFASSYCYLVTYIAWLITPLGISDNH